ncbi:MAG: YhcN/YlaJ family sporulation lipoprotein [Peptostreptococcales bacterium]
MNKKYIILASSFFILSSLIACTPANEKPLVDRDRTFIEQNNGPNGDGYSYLGGPGRYDDGNIMNNSTNANENETSRLMQNEDSIARKIMSLEGVRNAVVMVEDDTAYCGVDYENKSSTAINNLRQRIANEVKKFNPDIDTVFVTSDETSYDRMKEYLNTSGLKERTTELTNNIVNLFR